MKLSGKKILITAGPTQEPIDPVRYISNHSTGKMGIAIADECAARGASVTLIKGPTPIVPGHSSVHEVRVVTASQMYAAASQYFGQSDVIIFAAAVADYTPRYPSDTKIKKKDNDLILELEKTKDIAYELSRTKKHGQICVGFALETDSEMENATSKLTKKNLDMIVLNSLRDAGAGFGHDTNKVTIVDKSGNVLKFDLKSKVEVANDIISVIEKMQ